MIFPGDVLFSARGDAKFLVRFWVYFVGWNCRKFLRDWIDFVYVDVQV